MKMGDLAAQHEKSNSSKDTAPTQPLVRSPTKPLQAQILPDALDRPLPALPEEPKLPSPIRKQPQQNIAPPKSRKRKSSAINIPSDKENHEPDTIIEADTSNTALDNSSLPVQKNAKRAKTAATTYHNATTTAPAPKRTASKTQKKPATKTKNASNQIGVLSPRSHNSRTLPRSPVKDAPQPQSPSKVAQPASPLKQMQHSVSPFKSATAAATSALSSLAKLGATAAASLRPSSRDKDVAAPVGLTSPSGKMLPPPPRPALVTITSSHAAQNISPQRTASQASIRSAASEQSTISNKTNSTVVTKPIRTTTKTALTKRAPTTKTTTAAAKKITTAATKSKTMVSETTITQLSPKSGNANLKRAATTAAIKPMQPQKRVGATKKTTTTADVPVATGRVLRKRN